jgi:uncharacterized protein YjiS (DUF1127 family)
MHNPWRRTYIGNVTARGGAAALKADASRTTNMKNGNTLYNRFRRWRRYRETVRELQSLSTHELNDLGIQRGQISRLAREASQF